MANFNYAQLTTFNNHLTCYIQDGIIYQIVDFQNSKPIGVINETFEEALQKAEKYYNRLVELGDITPPKTQEEINKELAEANLQLTQMIKQLQNQLNDLQGGVINEHTNNSEDAGTKPASGRQSGKSKQQL